MKKTHIDPMFGFITECEELPCTFCRHSSCYLFNFLSYMYMYLYMYNVYLL